MPETPDRPMRAGLRVPFETASWARRVLAFIVDGLASTLVVITVIGPARYFDPQGPGGWLVLLVYVVQSSVLTATVGGSFGKLATRLRVVRAEGSPEPVPVVKAVLRQALIALLIPPLVFRPDGRGLHDVAAGSATVTLQTYRELRGLAARP